MSTNNDSPKYKAARMAAAEFSSDAQSAAKLYAKLTEQRFNNWQDALEDLKMQIPAYRWPTFDSMAEEYIFFNPVLGGDGVEPDKWIQCDASMKCETRLMLTLKKLMDTPDGKKERDDLEAVYKVLENIESLHLELNKVKGERNMLEAVLGNAKDIFESEEYNGHDKNRNMAQKRNRAIVASLKLNDKRPLRSILYREYINMIRHDNLDRKHAITQLVEGYNLVSEAGCAKQLSRELKNIRDIWAGVFRSRERTLTPINKMLKKLVPRI